jgi:hypothetical protein
MIVKQLRGMLLTGAVLASTANLWAGAVKTNWYPGWDALQNGEQVRLNYAKSFVLFNQPPGNTSKLNVVYRLTNAEPNSTYQVGVNIFAPENNTCPLSVHGQETYAQPLMSAGFGQFSPSFNCQTYTRLNGTIALEVYDLGYLKTDGDGNGELTVNISGIVPVMNVATAGNTRSTTLTLSELPIKFYVRQPNCTNDFPNKGCHVILQSPNPEWDNPTTITFR